MTDQVQYKTSNTDWSKFVTLSPEQRKQLIQEKVDRYRVQSEKNYRVIAHARALNR